MYELVISATKVKYKGAFEVGDVCSFTKKVFESRDYKVNEEAVNKSENPAEGTTSFELEMKANKTLDSYAKAVVEIKFNVDDYAKQEVFEGGHKVVKNKGEMVVEIKMILQLDYNNDWNVGLLGNLRPVFERVWYKEKIDGWKKKLSLELENMREDMKELFV